MLGANTDTTPLSLPFIACYYYCGLVLRLAAASFPPHPRATPPHPPPSHSPSHSPCHRHHHHHHRPPQRTKACPEGGTQPAGGGGLKEALPAKAPAGRHAGAGVVAARSGGVRAATTSGQQHPGSAGALLNLLSRPAGACAGLLWRAPVSGTTGYRGDCAAAMRVSVCGRACRARSSRGGFAATHAHGPPCVCCSPAGTTVMPRPTTTTSCSGERQAAEVALGGGLARPTLPPRT